MREGVCLFLSKIFLRKGHPLHPELPAPQILQQTGVRLKVKPQIVAVQRLPGLAVLPVDIPFSILPVSQQRVPRVREGRPDLMGPARQKLRLHKTQRPLVSDGAVEGNSGLPPRNGAVVDGNPLFSLVLQQEALQLPLRRLHGSQSHAEVFFGNLPIPDLCRQYPQGFGVLRRNHDAAGVAVDAVAQGRGESVLPFGVPLPLLVEIGLDVVDEGVHLLRLIRVDHQSGTLVRQEDILVLVQNIQTGLEEGEEQVVLPGLLKKLVVDVYLEYVPRHQALVTLTAGSVALDPLDADIFLQQGPGQQRHILRQKAVQPLSRIIFSDGKFSHSAPFPAFVRSAGWNLYPAQAILQLIQCLRAVHAIAGPLKSIALVKPSRSIVCIKDPADRRPHTALDRKSQQLRSVALVLFTGQNIQVFNQAAMDRNNANRLFHAQHI